MAEADLTQQEADALLALEKHRVDDQQHQFPAASGALTIALRSPDRREEFLLDVRRGRIDLCKVTYQNRARQVVALARLDIAGAPHRNPDGVEVACPHLHVYRAGYGDKWAEALPPDRFADPSNLRRLLDGFLLYCNVTRPPLFEKGLFP